MATDAWLVSQVIQRLQPDPAPVTPAAGGDDVILWRPLPGPQTLAYRSDADELFFGGAGGGGKTWLALGLAATAHRASIIFRREYKQFRGPKGIVEESRRIIGPHGDLNENLLLWRHLPGGRAIEFGAMQKATDWEKYKGRAHDLKVFDELPEFLEVQYRSAIGWARTDIPGQRVRVVGTGNPPTNPEGQWVISYWGPWLDPHHPHPAQPGELRWYAVVDGQDVERADGTPFVHAGERIAPRSRTFIPARVEDNPYLMATGYDQVLNSLPEPLRSQMRFGNFQATTTDNPWQVIPTAWVREAQARWTDERPVVTTRDGDSRPMPMSALGCDPSRGGRDATTLAKRFGAWLDQIEKHAGKDVPDGPAVASLVFKAVDGDLTIPINIDVIGAGASGYDHARGLKLNANGLNGSEASTATDKSGKLRFVNKRAEWHWHLRELLDPASGQAIALPPDTELLADLCAPRWKPTPRGIQVELKEDIKKRIGRSPDKGEAAIYAFVEDLDAWLAYARGVVSEASKAKEQPR